MRRTEDDPQRWLIIVFGFLGLAGWSVVVLVVIAPTTTRIQDMDVPKRADAGEIWGARGCKRLMTESVIRQ